MNGSKYQHTRKEGLLAYLLAMSMDERKEFAERIGTSAGHLLQIGYGQRPCKPSYAVSIDRESGGKVSMRDLCPDMDWDYIVAAVRADEVTVDKDTIRSQLRAVLGQAVDELDLDALVQVRRKEKETSHDTVQAS